MTVNKCNITFTVCDVFYGVSSGVAGGWGAVIGAAALGFRIKGVAKLIYTMKKRSDCSQKI
jgi:hypothetical protein